MRLPVISSLSILAAYAGLVTAFSISITQNETHAISPTLYGYMWEDINHSGDGGLYAELLQNRAFQAVLPGTGAALNGWQPVNGAFLSVTANTTGVSSALPNSLEVQIPSTAKGDIGFSNTGYWGIKVQAGWTYTGSLYVKAPTYNGPITVALTSSTGTVFDSKTLACVSSSWTKISFQFLPNITAADINNLFTVTVDGQAAQGATLYFGLFSLFPPTFRGRENGLRMDLAGALFDTAPKFWRFPGGNNLEGESTPANRWKWNETIGPLEIRPGRIGDWGYANTDGLGLMEYLDWIEDLQAEPILGVWAGLSLSSPDVIVPQNELQPYVDDVINELHFITDPVNSSDWARLRAEYGHEQPYYLKWIEVGNEDFFASDSYASYRWAMFVDGINASFPNMFEFVATTYASTALDPPYLKIDFHQYSTPDWFISASTMFDNYTRNGTQFFVGEYAVTGLYSNCTLGSPSCGRLLYPTLQGAVAEAAFMTGMERNSDVVFAASYAPSLQHISSYQWTPDIITFDAGRIAKSASYYNQQLFAQNMGTHVLATVPAVTNDTIGTPLYWVASHHATNKMVYLKVANTGSADMTVALAFDFPVKGTFGTAQTISAGVYPTPGMYNLSNTLDDPTVVVPYSSSFGIVTPMALNYTFPQSSVTVLQLAVDF